MLHSSSGHSCLRLGRVSHYLPAFSTFNSNVSSHSLLALIQSLRCTEAFQCCSLTGGLCCSLFSLLSDRCKGFGVQLSPHCMFSSSFLHSACGGCGSPSSPPSFSSETFLELFRVGVHEQSIATKRNHGLSLGFVFCVYELPEDHRGSLNFRKAR